VFPLRHSSPECSADGRIAYIDFGVSCVDPSSGSYQEDTSKAGIWIYDTRNSSRFRFLASRGLSFREPDEPAWDPTGQLLTVTRGNALETYGLDGQRRWTMSTSGLAIQPSWSYDGQYILWDQTLGNDGIWVAHRDTLVPRRVFPFGGDSSWHPARLSILYITADGAGHPTFFELNLLDGTTDTLFALSMVATWPRYAPDGKRIVLTGWGTTHDLFTVSNTGQGMSRLTWGGGDEAAWSRDGTFLAYIRSNALEPDAAFNTLWRYDVAKREAAPLVGATSQTCGP
jgi:Tol biopolymer transport system component